jgi:predicted lipid-binding transport protein (Tim44 family)
MIMSRLLSAALAFALVSASYMTANAADDDKNKCTIATKEDNDVVKACKAGGIKRAKVAMKAMQKLAKDKGMKVECDDCHKDESNGDWTLTKDAQDKFKKMVALTRG